jgi:hypothetical protein
LTDQKVQGVKQIVSKLSAFALCHGRPRFLAYILDCYVESQDIDIAIGKFVKGIFSVDGQVFPLRFLKSDLDNNLEPLARIIEGKSLEQHIRDGILEFIMKGTFRLMFANDEAAATIRYGLGFVEEIDGLLAEVVVQEMAVIECLRYFIPFGDIVKTFAQKIASCHKPQMVGYLMEYLVAFALVANFSGVAAAGRISSCQNFPHMYLMCNDETQVCFPDHMCGPDIIFKSTKTKTVYFVQVKFLKSISKQEIVNACDTTDPAYFYCKRTKKGEVLKGFEKRKAQMDKCRIQLQADNWTFKQMLVIHTAGKQTSFTENAAVVTKNSNPRFFDLLEAGIWDFLDLVRNNFNKSI